MKVETHRWLAGLILSIVKYVPQEWRIHFRLAQVPSGDATLTIAVASSHRAHIAVYVNDMNTALTTVEPLYQGGNALVRQSEHAKYDVQYVSIPPSKLREGENVIGLSQTSVPRDGQSHVMYDYLDLELP